MDTIVMLPGASVWRVGPVISETEGGWE